MITDFVRMARDRIYQDIGQMSTALGNGSANHFDEYKRITGIIAGMKKAISIIDETYKEYMGADHDES